jgi:hypothetical protein
VAAGHALRQIKPCEAGHSGSCQASALQLSVIASIFQVSARPRWARTLRSDGKAIEPTTSTTNLSPQLKTLEAPLGSIARYVET